ncbi:N-acetylmuramoyl-L-alanine amidase [Paenibacillus sophorae]|uniref:N-acetylmuramoyl-L-alanine amidase n=1 Tax=Paenibacillus sophorae TaxID=1333845 RepID=A0A1H8NDE8_9BACL|nr:N-acetylmuramoyl-L-alanine amidase [Paenibacillus sophorae]QWU14676.1 N-acetylmuramoyl-L-alanine amidase [Paenibacillus sophorae]SEO27508.1 N-acetylmuramoyl-L-alanine amidase [Paenibacillus sophorae]
MSYQGFIIHTSVCPSINGKGFDFWIDASGTTYAAPLLTDPEYIHLCLEGDFGKPLAASSPAETKEQIFAACRLILDLAALYKISPVIVKPHNDSCPGPYFPWNELVLYPGDGYH